MYTDISVLARTHKVISLTWQQALSTKLFPLFEQGSKKKEAAPGIRSECPTVTKEIDRSR